MVGLTGQGIALVADDLHGVPFLSRGLIFFPYIYNTQIVQNSTRNSALWNHGRPGN
jgi:hypothetical protein